jgi:hypothetical protein
MSKLSVAIKSALFAGVAFTAIPASASDKELLETLFQNGVLNKAQFESLSKKADEKEAAAQNAASLTPAMTKALDWASRVKVSGDVRVRQEFRDSDDKGVEKSRQRIRARIAVGAKINDDVDAGFRLVTSGGTTSANKDLGDSFGGKNVYFDRAYIDWHPEFANGAHLIVGKMKMQWYRITDNVWDSDVNPEGILGKYSHQAGPVKLTGTAGYFLIDGENIGKDSFSDDMNMYHYGISGAIKFNNAVKASLGFNSYLYNGTEGNDDGGFDLGIKGNTTSDFKLYEVAGKVDIKMGVLPIKLYGSYVVNAADMDTAQQEDQDTAWLAGIGTKWNAFKLDYNYRDTQANAVVDAFNDSDFNDGSTSSRGHKIKLGYNISKNFAASLAYMAAEEYGARALNSGRNDRDTFQIDLKAKF